MRRDNKVKKEALDEKRNYDLSKEQTVLGSLLSEDTKEAFPKVIKAFRNLGKNVFYYKTTQVIYQAIIELHNRGNPVEPTSVYHYVKEQLKIPGLKEYIFKLLDHDLGQRVTTEYYAKDLYDLAIRRQIEQLGQKITEAAKKDTPTSALIEETEEKLTGLKKQSINEKKSMTLLESLNTPIVENPSPIGGGLLVPGRYTILAATDGEGKTTFCLQLALCAVTGTPFLGRFPIEKPAKVLYFCGENSRGDINDKARKQLEALLGRTVKDDLKKLTLVEPQNVDFLLDKKEGRPYLNSWLETCKPDIVIFDPLNNFVSADDTLNNDSIARKTSKTLNKIATDFNCFPILTTHFKKKQEDGTPEINPNNVFEMFHGSKYWTNPAASQIAMTRANKQKYPTAKRIHFKFKTVTEVSPMLLLRSKNNLWYKEISRDEISKAKLTPNDLVEILKRKSPGETIPSIFMEVAAKELDCSQTQIRELLKVAKRRGLIVQKEGMLRIVEIKRQATLPFEKK
jgi:hypothetical protein